MFLIILSCIFMKNVCVSSAPIGSVLDNSVYDGTATILTAGKDLGSNLLTPPVSTRETVRQETEGFPSAVLSVYDDGQKKASDYLMLRPIVDTIQEHEKYGNNGEMLGNLNRAIVNGYEAFSNLMNRLFVAPENLIRTFSKTINGKLDNIGARIVGLA